MAPLFSNFLYSYLQLSQQFRFHAPTPDISDILAAQPDSSSGRVSNISECPKLLPRIYGSGARKNVHDLRPDEFDWVMAIGDSISAGAFAKGIQNNTYRTPWPILDPLATYSENRGSSYCMGGDGSAEEGDWTLPNFIKYYNPDLRGYSHGQTKLQVCSGPACAPGSLPYSSPRHDRLNAALSGAMASNLLQEIESYLIPQSKLLGVEPHDFKYINLQIGSNDICALCPSTLSSPFPSIAPFSQAIEDSLFMLREHFPNSIVNLLGVFKVSEVYQLTKGESYCQKLIPLVPHFEFECSCALLPGPAGDTTRKLMDQLADEYNVALEAIAKRWQTQRFKDFAVTWQPLMFNISGFPIEALSDVDCFHPSLAAHRQIAKHVWNMLITEEMERKNVSLQWERGGGKISCLDDDTRISTRSLLDA